MTTIIGIDPGKTGAIAIIHRDELQLLAKLPDRRVLSDWLSDWQTFRPRVYVEHVSAGGRLNAEGRTMGASSAFTFGVGYGTILGIIAAHRMLLDLVRPQRWIADMGLTRCGKDAHAAMARQLHPDAKVHKYAADAVLIAEWGRRQVTEI